MLLPSITTIDIKRNLPQNVDIKIVEGRLRVLENEGHIYYEKGRWWLTTKGRDALGISSKQLSSGSIRMVLDKTFAKYEGQQEPKHTVLASDLTRLAREINHARNNLVESTSLRASEKMNTTEYEAAVINLTKQVNQTDRKLRQFISKRKETLQKEIVRLESDLAIKRKELNDLEKVSEEA